MKYAFIQQEKTHYPVCRLCDVLGVSRSGYYDWFQRVPSKRDEANTQLLTKIKALYKEKGDH